MSLNPLGAPRFRAFDANGDPLVGGLLYTYSAGTVTPRETYEDSGGLTVQSNPIALDANGEADVWLTPGVLYRFVLKDSSAVEQWDVDNYPSAASASASTDEVATDPGGRLTLTSGTPVTTSDVTGATTIYYAPYKSDKVPLYDGAAWALYSIGSSGLSQTTGDNTKSPAAVTTNSNYDLFVWNDSGTVRLSRGPLWSSDTTRGTGAGTTELQQVNGCYVNKVSISNGPGAQRGLYVGTVRSDGSSQINDSMAKRHTWNAYNRTVRPMRVIEATDTWSYVGVYRQANGSTSNQLDFVVGLNEVAVACVASVSCSSSNTGSNMAIGIGLDSTSSPATDCLRQHTNGVVVAMTHSIAANYRGFPGIGRHYLAWLEFGVTATITWYGDAGGTVGLQSGIHGEISG